MAYTFAEALRQAGKTPTRQSIVDAVEKGDLPGPGIVPFGYDDHKSHQGYIGVQVGTIKDGALDTSGTQPKVVQGEKAVPSDFQTTQPPANGVPAT